MKYKYWISWEIIPIPTCYRDSTIHEIRKDFKASISKFIKKVKNRTGISIEVTGANIKKEKGGLFMTINFRSPVVLNTKEAHIIRKIPRSKMTVGIRRIK